MKTIYLDNNATTRVADEALEAMLPYFKELYGNPSSIHHFGSQIAKKLDEARQRVADFLGCRITEVIFTSGGTESNNMAIKGVLAAHPKKKHVITTEVEHQAVLNPVMICERQGYEVTRVPVDSQGRLEIEDISDAIGEDTALVSVMAANNETGVVFPWQDVAKLCAERGVTFHCDGVQAAGKMPLNLNESQVDLFSVSGHKLHAPKGIGCLYVRRGLKFRSMIHGGHQEGGRRAGTENVPAVIGLGRACELLAATLQADSGRVRWLRDRLERGIIEAIPGARINGEGAERLPNTTSIRFEGCESEAVLIALDEAGICASPGSACTSGSVEPSHVLLAMALTAEEAASAVRFSLSRYTSEAEINHVLEKLPGIIARLEGLSPSMRTTF